MAAMQGQDVVERGAVLVIADISGYTKFMLSHQKALVHSQMIISELLNTIVGSADSVLEVAKLEGDAVFFFAYKKDESPQRDSEPEISEWAIRVFEEFNEKVAELLAYSICKCDACASIGGLQLKVIVHSGEILPHKIGPFYELAGLDVIIVHRLLKNSVEADQYLLVSDSTINALSFPADIEMTGFEEVYDVGTVKCHVHYPSTVAKYVPDPSEPFTQSSVAVEILRHEIRQEYCQVADNPEKGFHFHLGRKLAGIVEYPEAWFDNIPERTVESFAGTGNPLSMGEAQTGEHVVDIGCGAGLDSLIASKCVGPEGRVIGLDMTPEMLEKARSSADEMGATNVEFKDAYAESLPVPDGWADLVISNGAINLSPHKPTVFQEINRVLKPGGRLQIADIIVQKMVPEEAKRDIDLWSG
jgi:arsenite methyltransferase